MVIINLADRIKTIYPELTWQDFVSNIKLRNDGGGDYIEEWNHPTLSRPTDDQIKNTVSALDATKAQVAALQAKV